MGAVESVLTSIKQEINSLPTDEFGAVIFANEFGDIIQDVPALDDLLHPDSDVEIEGFIPDKMDILGTYTPMRSPGVVTLRRRALRNFFWSIVRELLHRKLGAFITPADLERISAFIVKKTYYHEIFHFNSDVLGMLFNRQLEKNTEEALAVAYSHLMTAAERASSNTQLGRANAVLFNHAFELAYRYTSPGYQDWVHYADVIRFKNGLLDYMKPNNYQKLQSNGIAVEDLLYDMLGKPQGFVERVW